MKSFTNANKILTGAADNSYEMVRALPELQMKIKGFQFHYSKMGR